MKIILSGAKSLYELQGLCRQFYPETDFVSDDRILKLSVAENRVTAELTDCGQTYCATAEIGNMYDALRIALKGAAYDAMSAATGITSLWGLFTGIKPAAYLKLLTDKLGSDAETVFRDGYRISEQKLRLCKSVIDTRKDIAALAVAGTASLYISIPFCPSRCAYCSFVSASTASEGKYLEPYVARLKTEIAEKCKMLASLGVRVLSVYIGGGTPTVLSANDICDILKTVRDNVDMGGLLEFTVEAGRPDTFTTEKLEAMKSGGVTRISVNPQTLDDKVLAAIGRKHTVDDFFKAYELAAKYDFDINVDLIAGLPSDTPESFEKSVRGVVGLKPANVTLHTLYIKRASDFGLYGNLPLRVLFENTGKMVDVSHRICADNSYLPYYLYRQKSTVGNHENVGFAMKNKICAYNIFMMDDIQTVIGAGAGAMTKIVPPDSNAVRFANTKFAYNYIAESEFNTEPVREALRKTL